MKMRIILPAILSAVVLSTPAWAEELDLMNSHKPNHTYDEKMAECTDLQGQFDTAIKAHENANKAAAARDMRAEGSKMCTDGRYVDGIAKLEQALNDIGVTVVR